MRQLGQRRAASLAAAVVAVTALATACGQVKAGSTASGSTPAPPTSTPTACATPASPSTSPHVLTLGGSDNGKTFCVKVGTGVFVYLHGSLTQKWSPITPNSAKLAPRPSGRMMLALGVTGGYFVALHPGTATLTSSRNECGPAAQPTAPTTSGAQHCSGIGTVYHVTLMISG